VALAIDIESAASFQAVVTGDAHGHVSFSGGRAGGGSAAVKTRQARYSALLADQGGEMATHTSAPASLAWPRAVSTREPAAPRSMRSSAIASSQAQLSGQVLLQASRNSA